MAKKKSPGDRKRTLSAAGTDELADRLHIASRSLASAVAESAQSHGTSGMEASVLLKIDAGLESPKRIAAAIGIDASNLSRLLRKMEAAKLVRRGVDEANRSRVVITATAKGRRLAAKLEADVQAVQRDAFAALSPGESKTLGKLLQKLVEQPAG